MIQMLLKKLYAAIQQDLRCPRKMALSVCAGIYIAFSPFIALHTVMVIIAAYFFTLNGAVMFAVSNLINNPWTMLPVYGLDYVCGQAIFCYFNIQGTSHNPAWVTTLNHCIQRYIMIPNFSFWTFMIGGNVLGIAVAIIAYPFVKRLFVRWLANHPTGI